MKQKKALGIVACSMLFVASAIGLAGCGGEKHEMTEKSAKSPTCTEAGYKAHYECSDCGKYFADADGKNELPKEEVELPATGHDVQKHAKADASCTADGYTQDFWYCANDCGSAWSNEGATEVIQNSDSLVIPATEHRGTMTPVEYKAPGIEQTGIMAHYHCSACGKDFENMAGDNEIKDVIIPALQEKDIDAAVYVYDAAGKPVTDTGALTFTVKGVRNYENVTITSGKLSLKKAYEGKYTVEAEGYQTAELIVGENGTSELLIVPEFFSDDNPLEGNKITLRLDKTADGVSRTVTVSSSESFAVDGALLGDVNWGDGSIVHGKFGRAKIALTSEQENAAGIYFETTLKLTKNESVGGGDRFAIQIGKGLGGFVVPRDGKQFMVSPIASDKKGEFTLNQFEPPVDISKECANISTAGVRIRIKRLMNVYTFYIHDGTEWKEIQTQTIGSDNAKNEVLLAGAHGDWEFGAIKLESIKTESFDYKAPEEGEDGYKAHVKITDGDRIIYFIDGKIVEWTDIEIPALEVSAATVKLYLIDFDGSEAEVPANFTLTLVSDSITYENVTVNSDGTLNLGTGKKLYSENYTVTAEGYLKTSISISRAATEKILELTPEFVTSSNPNDFEESYLELSIEKDTGKKTVTMHAKEDGDLGACLEKKHSEVIWPLSDEAKNAQAIVIETTIKFVSGDKSPADRVGIQMTDDMGGYVLWHNGGRLDEIEKGHRAGLTLNQSPNNTGYYSGTSIENGWKLRFERVGTAVVLRIWENGEWKVIMEGTCGANAKNDIRLMAAHGVWEFSEVEARVMTFEQVPAKAPTTTAAGNVAHYTATDGTDVYYFTAEMKATDLDGVTLPVLEEVDADVTVNLIGTDGNQIMDTSAIKFTLESISYTYNDVALVNGKLPAKIYEGTYTIFAEGFGKGKFTVEKNGEAVTVTLYQGFENSNPASSGTVEIAYEKDGGNTTQKITLTGKDTNAAVIYEQRAEVQLLLTAEQKNAKSLIVTGKLKFTGKKDNLARGGMTMTTDWEGFMLWLGNEEIDKHVASFKLDQSDRVGRISFEAITAGIEFRMVRAGTAIRLYFKEGDGWQLAASVSCDENLTNDIRFAGGLGVWEYSDFEIITPTYNAVAAVAPSNGTTGNCAYYTLTIGNTVEYYLTNGTPTCLEDVTVSTLASASMTDLIVSGSATLTVDLDADTLNVGGLIDGRTILAYQRYGKNASGEVAFYEKDGNNMIGNTGLFEATGRVIDDFCGNTNDIKFISNGITSAATGATEDAGSKFSVTLSLTKNVKQIVLFTGKWGGGDWAFTLAETNGGVVAAYNNAFSGSRAKMLVFEIDNSAWGSGEASHDLVLTVEGCNAEYAALVLLGDVTTTAATKAEMSRNAVSTDNTVINLDGTELDGRTILAYQRYGKEEATDAARVAFYEKDDSNMIGDTGLYAATGRVINDFGGNTDCIKFTSNGITNSSTGCTTDASQKLSVTLSLTKDVKQIVLYTGSWSGTVFQYELTESDGAMIRSMRWQGGNPRAIRVVVDLDTSAWTDDEPHDVVFSLEGSCCMFGALVLLGDTVS